MKITIELEKEEVNSFLDVLANERIYFEKKFFTNDVLKAKKEFDKEWEMQHSRPRLIKNVTKHR